MPSEEVMRRLARRVKRLEKQLQIAVVDVRETYRILRWNLQTGSAERAASAMVFFCVATELALG